MSRLAVGPDGKLRCKWCVADAEYVRYHDTEWGFPVADEFRLFEKICLEGFQSGLSWRTILRKRENFRQAFAHFDYQKLALWGEMQVEELLQNTGVVRHRGKIEATLNNARCAVQLAEREGSLSAYLWRWMPERGSLPSGASTSPESVALSQTLKKQGWKFVGPTTIYSLMQAMGLINDHEQGCVIREQAEDAYRRFSVPA